MKGWILEEKWGTAVSSTLMNIIYTLVVQGALAISMSHGLMQVGFGRTVP